jgi:hypothetical protein
MAIVSITLPQLLMPLLTFVLISPICQITFAQNNETQSTQDIENTATFNTIIAAVSGGLVGAAQTPAQSDSVLLDFPSRRVGSPAALLSITFMDI